MVLPGPIKRIHLESHIGDTDNGQPMFTTADPGEHPQLLTSPTKQPRDDTGIDSRVRAQRDAIQRRAAGSRSLEFHCANAS